MWKEHLLKQALPPPQPFPTKCCFSFPSADLKSLTNSAPKLTFSPKTPSTCPPTEQSSMLLNHPLALYSCAVRFVHHLPAFICAVQIPRLSMMTFKTDPVQPGAFLPALILCASSMQCYAAWASQHASLPRLLQPRVPTGVCWWMSTTTRRDSRVEKARGAVSGEKHKEIGF